MRFAVALMLPVLFVASTCFAEEPLPEKADPPPGVKAEEGDQVSKLKLENYLIPAVEILAYETALNLFDRAFLDSEDFDSSWSSFTYNLGHGWVFDDDAYEMNQFLHPYGGSIYYGFARSAGLSFYESFLYTLAGSTIWEYAGEKTRPSINDGITTTIAGTFLGEALFRISQLLLEDAEGSPGVLRELAAAAISPPTGLNRNAFGHTFDKVFPSRAPAVYTRFSIGGLWNTTVSDTGVPEGLHRAGVIANLTIAYGQPGKSDYPYTRPFDYFRMDLELSSIPEAILQSLLLHGMIVGEKYDWGPDFRGIWGIYGIYDYISPELFRASNTGLAVGTSFQWWLSKDVALQTTALAGVGFGAGGTIATQGERDYHYGVAPEAVLGLHLLLSDFASLDLTGREYLISGVGSDDAHGVENVVRVQLGATVRFWRSHAVTLQYTVSRRDAYYADVLDDRHQTVGSVSLVYTLVGDPNFGAVEWREDP